VPFITMHQLLQKKKEVKGLNEQKKCIILHNIHNIIYNFYLLDFKWFSPLYLFN